ncbi:MAG: Ig-like domain-containing protein [Lachnospiraceae bacterium]|nr:Ig-like domain-containing protein [Lachnospiraceae bacterium]
MKIKCLNCMSEYESELGLCPNCGYDPEEPMENTLHMKPGSLLHGRYLVGRALGSGGFGITYVGWDFTLQQKVAIKEYLPSEFATRALGETQVTVYSGNKGEQYNSGLEKFVEEARHLAKFQSTDGIVRVFDSFKENNTAYIIMEYLEGETLASYLEHAGKIPVDEAIAILEPVMYALEAVHTEGIIHRDIAPDNIFLTTDGHVRLIDFGASRYATTSHSRSLTVIIKQGYSPEEQYRSRGDQGSHTDVYAMGAVLYRMITGITPPDAMERRAYFETENKDILVPPSKSCKIDKNKENAILNAMNVRIEDRTKTIKAFLGELKSDKPVARVSGKIRAFDMMRWPLWAKISIPAAALVAVVLLTLLLTGRIGFLDTLNRDAELAENETRVVEVTNQSLGVAQELLYAESVKSVAVEYLPYDDIATNIVIEQDYSAGSIVEEGTVVSLYLSNSTSSLTSAEKNTMPSVLYRTREEAAAMLEEAGITYSVTEVNSIYAEGTVVWADRLEGDAISDSDTVELVVSKGVAEEGTLSVNLDATSLYVGDTITLTVDGMSGSCTWSSSEETIASVDNDGRVTANEEGTVKITASVGDDSAICYLTVFDYSIRIKTGKMAIFAGGTATVTVSGAPGGTVFEWNSSDDSVAEVKSGSIYGTGNGTAKITANCTINGRTYTTDPVSVTVTTNGIILSAYDISGFYVGDSIALTAETNPENEEIIWESSDPDIVSVKDGLVTGVGEGTAEVLAKFDEYEAVCSVTVTEPRISISGAKDTLPVDDTVTLNCVFTPSGQAINWTSSNSKVCTVDASGTVTAVSAGTATITAGFTYQGIEYSDTYEMTVKDRVILSASSAELTVTNTKKLTATTDPSGQSVTWSSSNTDIATVSSDGTVTAVGDGSATITAKSTINGKSYSSACTVKVNPPTINLSRSSLSLTVTESGSLNASVNPSGFSVTWSSSNTDVATVNSSGTVTAVGEGSATITAMITVNSKSYTAKCNVSVAPPSISISKSAMSLVVSETGTLNASVNPS